MGGRSNAMSCVETPAVASDGPGSRGGVPITADTQFGRREGTPSSIIERRYLHSAACMPGDLSATLT